MAKVLFNKNLFKIVEDGDLEDIASELVETAESEEWVKELIIAARKENSGNSELLDIAKQLGIDE